MYCVTNFDFCAFEAKKEEIANQAMFDSLTSLYGAAGGISRAGAGTAKASEAAAIRAKGDLCNSFTGDTFVLMADGTQKPIPEVRVGDTVLNADPDTGEIEKHTVTHITDVQTAVGDKDLVDIVVATPAGAKIISSTANHLFWNDTDRSWTEADDLAPGILLDTPADSNVAIQAIHRRNAVTPTYDLTIETVHTYYVIAGTTPVLVHNCGGSIALGKQTVGTDDMALDIFAMERGALTYKEWTGSGLWHEQLKGFISDGKTKIHVNLDGIVDPIAYAKSGANVDVTDVAGRGFTRWEMHQLSVNPAAWNRVTWYSEGKVVGNPFIK